MVLDEDLVARARRAGDDLVYAERSVQMARAELHAVIRRMHLAGGTLREIAHALGVSHQRVQQIVKGAGGTWWTRVWRTRDKARDMVCTFCERPPSELANLLAGPNVFICDDCVRAADRAMSGRPTATPRLSRAGAGAKAACSFCSKRASAQRPMARGDEANVCAECVAVCHQILADRGNPSR
jgi:hypothetical protein